MSRATFKLVLVLFCFAVLGSSIRHWQRGSFRDDVSIDDLADLVADLRGESKDPFALLEAKYNYKKGFSDDMDIARINPFRDLDLYDSPYPAVKLDFKVKRDDMKLNFDPYYCDAVDYENLKNPHWLMTSKFVASDYLWPEIKRFIVDAYGEDNSQILHKPTDHDLSHNITVFFLHRGNFDFLRRMGVDHLCYSQSYAVVNGMRGLTWKKAFAQNFFDYSEQYKDKPSCINSNSFFPTTYLLDDENQCKAFFTIMNSEAYAEKKKTQPLQYLIKISENVDEGMGVFLLDQAYEDKINEKYGRGEYCGIKKDKLLAQYYISNPLLLDHKHKFDFRMHAFIASTNPVMVYFRDGLVRVSLQEYDIGSKDLKNHLTNVHVSQSIVKAEKDPKKHQELLDYQVQNLTQFQDYLLREGLITDHNWVDNYLRPQFMKAMAHITRMTKHTWSKRSGLFRLLGADFMIDTDLKVWFIETNYYPMLFRTRPDVWDNTKKLVQEMIDIETGLLRSRMSRVGKFMREYITQCMLPNETCNKDEWREKFFKINIDKMEPEFAPSSENGWRLVVDLGKSGRDAYSGLLDDTCFE